MSDDLMDRFDEVEAGEEDEEIGQEDKTSRDSENPNTTSSNGSTRSRSQYPLYLSEDLQEKLDDRFNKFNARRELNDKQQVEKHKHFLEGLIRSALDSDDFKEYVEEEL